MTNNLFWKTETDSFFYLEPKFERVKSYYKKAYVKYERDFVPALKGPDGAMWQPVGGQLVLYSYERKVCALDYETGEYVLFGVRNNWEDSPFTATTRRHIKEFLLQNGVDSWNTWKDVYNNATGIYACGKWIKGSPLHSCGMNEEKTA